MSTLNIQLYDVLRQELNISEEKARKITIAIETVVKEDKKNVSIEYKSIFKDDFKEIDDKLEKLDAKIGNEISRLEGRIDVKIEQTKSDLIKWFVSLFVVLALMIIGLYTKK